MKKTKDDLKYKYKFFLNPYKDQAFTRCPKCENKTKVRKFIFFIHVEPKQPIILNKSGKFCPYCEMIIVNQDELEKLLCFTIEKFDPKMIGNKYIVGGTIDKSDISFKKVQELEFEEVIKHLYVFKDILSFKVIPGGWYKKP